MSLAPEFLNDTIQRFGEALGLKTFALNDRGAASLKFDSGLQFSLEYGYETLSIMMTVPCEANEELMKKLLLRSHYDAQHPYKLRTGFLEKTSRAFFAVRLRETDVTLPVLQNVWNMLWAEAQNFGGAK